MGKKLNLDYMMIHACYWCCYIMAGNYISVYMLGKDYPNTVIGIVLAVGNIVSLVLQAAISSFVDSRKNVSVFTVINILLVVLFIMAVGVLVIGVNCLVLTILYTGYISIHTTLQPFINSIPGKLLDGKHAIYYGPARAIGSLSGGTMCMLLGVIIARTSVDAIPAQALITILIIEVFLIRLQKNYKKTLPDNYSVHRNKLEEGDQSEEAISTIEFIKRNKLFIGICVGYVTVWFMTVIVENYTLQIIKEVGGGVSQLGIVTLLLCICEMPAMIFFGWFRNKFKYGFLLKLGVTFNTIKMLVMTFAPNMLIIYLSQPLQILGLGLIMPTMVYMVNDIMEEREAVRGQSIVTMGWAIGLVIGSVFGGIILDAMGVHSLMLITSAITIMGAIVMYIFANKLQSKIDMKG